MLKCETNTAVIKEEIIAAAKTAFKAYTIEDDVFHAIFEHGQWWVRFFDVDEEMDRTFSVVDAEGPGSINGFDFEEV